MTSRTPGDPTSGVSPVLTALVARMRDAGIAPGVEELADALWLARWLPGPAQRSRTAAGPPLAQEPSAGTGTQAPRPVPSVRPRAGGEEPAQPDGARLFAPGPGGDGTGTRMTPVRVPAAPALPEPLALQRGLRPLQRYRAPVRPVPRTLDEQATAERAAESGLVLPVLRTDRRREARLLLLMDVSTSTVVWQQALDELRQVCARAGAFREVQMRYLHEAPGGLPGCAATPQPGAALSAPEQLSDPTGRRVTLVLSDCAGPMWRNGRVQRLLHHWAATAPVAVVQPLPQRMWLRTHLPARRGMLHRSEGPAGSLRFRPDRGPVEAGALPVPVLALRRESVEGWARLVSGATGQSLAAAAGWVRADHPASGAPLRAAQERGAEERVRGFWRRASSEARRLAVYLSAVPLYLPVMQLVQHAMLAGSGPDVLAEVLLSGLLRRQEDADDARGVRYYFLPGVASELRSRLTVEEVELLFKHCSEYVERKFGRSARNFPALAGAFLRGAVPPDGELPAVSGEREPAGLRAFAEVSAAVLRDLGARLPPLPVAVAAGQTPVDLLELGRRALARFHEEGLTRELDAAVGYFGVAATEARSDTERVSAHEDLADALLTRWRVRRVGDDLREAWEAVEDTSSLSGRLVRGLVCWTQAQEVRYAGVDFDGIPDSLREWARQEPRRAEERALRVLLYVAEASLAAVVDARDAPSERRKIAAEVLTDVRREMAELGPDEGIDAEFWYVCHLERAGDAVEVWLGGPDGLVVRGRLWLDLARQYAGQGPVARPAPDRWRAEYCAARAGDDLVEAAGRETALPDAERCRIWLDAAAAIEIEQPPRDDGRERRTLVYAVEEALRAAGDDEALRYKCHAWAARIYSDRYAHSADRTQLDRAIDAWSEALSLLGEDDPRRPRVLTGLGLALSVRWHGSEEAQDAFRSVDHLREAVDLSPPDDPQLPVRRRSLADAYIMRYRLTRVLTELYEADWLLGEAVRGAEGPVLLTQCWNSRANLSLELYERTGAVVHLHTAIDRYSKAVAYAEEAGDDELLALALMGRGLARERQGRPNTAGSDYARAQGLTSRASTGDIRRRPSRLSPETADE
ncbi:SAV_2336 N-terminal domain-related protein [Streptomyces barringtoniae]|uniref:SAV_2336 N-terminal domain-related protein n=1 Tax=Streptomyces barringtoniae TaxID=2892029 RepID=UPI001E3FFBB5|nr:SAV_2336 N-terminal domain-related protein [Streptomyces barringtoniae]MCC5478987.1 metallophosphoesterase [Streptomyces barringtoniae]